MILFIIFDTCRPRHEREKFNFINFNLKFESNRTINEEEKKTLFQLSIFAFQANHKSSFLFLFVLASTTTSLMILLDANENSFHENCKLELKMLNDLLNLISSARVTSVGTNKLNCI